MGDVVHGVTRFDRTAVGNTYDGQARLVAQTLPGLTNEFSYTPGGRLVEASGAGVTVSNVYDGFGRLLAQQQHGAGPAQTVEYTWHPVGTVSNIITAAGTWTHRYDPADRLTNLVSEAGGFAWSYNPDNGLPSMRTAHTGLKVQSQYDILDRLTNMVWRNGSNEIIRSFAYAYNAAPMITNVVRENGERRLYTYDNLDRLTRERVEGASTNDIRYLLDLAGNRTRKIVNGSSTWYTLGMGNKLSTFGVMSAFHYDAAGNVTNAVYDGGGYFIERELDLSWDGAYRLTSASNSMAGVEFYGYDAFDRRVWISDGIETNYLIHAGPHVVAETDSAGVVIRSYTYGPGIDNILSMTVYSGGTTTTYWYITDHLNTVWALVDENGTVVESYEYDAFGSVKVFDGSGTPVTESAVGNRFLFQGREYSWATGLYYFRARYCDPTTGRWLSKDPIGIAGGINQYAFVDSNPINMLDPEGLWGIHFGNLIRIGNDRPWLVFESSDWAETPRGAAAAVDGAIPFIDPFADAGAYDPCDEAFQFSQKVGGFGIQTLAGVGALRGLSALGSTRAGHLLNHNRYLRIGPGRMPRSGPFPASHNAPRISIGPQRPGVNNPHIDLRIRGIDPTR